MTANLHLDRDYENVDVRATAFKGEQSSTEPFVGLRTEPYFVLRIAQNTTEGSNEVVVFVDSKHRQDFAERIYNAIMALPNLEEEGGQDNENHD